VQDPGESFTVHGGGKCKILENPSLCNVAARERSWRQVQDYKIICIVWNAT